MSQDEDQGAQRLAAGSLILADPSLRDPNFIRTALLLTEHSATDGALGFVLNRPLGKQIGEVLTTHGFETLADVPVYLGGPVSTEQLTLASLHWDPETDRLQWQTHLSMEEANHRREEGSQVRAFVGYAGWSGGQLESEVQQKAWITCQPDQRILEEARIETLWIDLLKSMGPWYRLLAGTPEDPSLN